MASAMLLKVKENKSDNSCLGIFHSVMGSTSSAANLLIRHFGEIPNFDSQVARA